MIVYPTLACGVENEEMMVPLSGIWWQNARMSSTHTPQTKSFLFAALIDIPLCLHRTGVKVGIAWLSQLCETQVSQQIEGMASMFMQPNYAKEINALNLV